MIRIRRTAVLPLAALALAACGGSSTHRVAAPAASPSSPSSPAPVAAGSDVRGDVLRSALVATSHARTFRQRITADTTVHGQVLHSVVTTAYDQTAKRGYAEVVTPGSPTIREVIAGGALYLTLPGRGPAYRFSISQLVGTRFAQAGDPTQGLQLLQAETGPLRAAGSATVDGERMTHYAGRLDLGKALAKIGGAAGALLKQQVQRLEAAPAPFDAYVDAAGRLRRLTTTLRFAVQGTAVSVREQVDTGGFGQPVVVKVPARSQDGTPLLSALRGATTG